MPRDAVRFAFGRFDPARYGVTRLADLTGLDRVGLPVWAAIRPMARSFAQVQGKGMSHVHARMTALMEAVETHCAEQADRLVVFEGTLAEAQGAGHAALDPGELGKCRDPGRAGTARLCWVPGVELSSGRRVLVPLDAVSLDFRLTATGGMSGFVRCSVGLAAHPQRDNAILAGLLEVIENDALAQAMAWRGLLERCPAPALRVTADLRRGLARVTGAGLVCDFRDLTSDLGLPVIRCDLYDPGTAGMPGIGTFSGQACRFTPEDAALAALLEAVQSRLTDISGAREDIGPGSYRATEHVPAAAGAGRARISALRPTSAADGIARILDRMAGAGLSMPVVVDLADGEDGPACVSVVCPGMEGGPAGEGYRTGPRARQAILRQVLGRS